MPCFADVCSRVVCMRRRYHISIISIVPQLTFVGLITSARCICRQGITIGERVLLFFPNAFLLRIRRSSVKLFPITRHAFTLDSLLPPRLQAGPPLNVCCIYLPYRPCPIPRVWYSLSLLFITCCLYALTSSCLPSTLPDTRMVLARLSIDWPMSVSLCFLTSTYPPICVSP